jgi:lyso-ornithine lipid O-acyltransferase
MVLFAEGTSSDGNRVLPLRSSLFGAVELSGAAGAAPAVQTLAIVYTRRHGLPLGRADRPGIGWYGDMELGPHAWALLRGGPIDVSIRIGAPLSADVQSNRKSLTKAAEAELRGSVVRLLRGLPANAEVAVSAQTLKPAPPRSRHAASAKWS